MIFNKIFFFKLLMIINNTVVNIILCNKIGLGTDWCVLTVYNNNCYHQ